MNDTLGFQSLYCKLAIALFLQEITKYRLFISLVDCLVGYVVYHIWSESSSCAYTSVNLFKHSTHICIVLRNPLEHSNLLLVILFIVCPIDSSMS